MPFENPILAGEELIRSAIRSRNYIESAQGWKVSRDGAAEFSDLTTRGATTGDTAQFNALTLGGYDLQQQLDDDLQGIIAKFDWTNATETWTGAGPHRIIVIPATLPAGRYCRVEVNGFGIGSTVAGDGVRGFFRYTTDGTTPVEGSTNPLASLSNFPPVEYANDIQFGPLVCWISNPGTTDLEIKIALFAARYRGSGNVLAYANNRAICSVHDNGIILPNQGTKYAPDGTSTTELTNYDKTWSHTGIRSYNESDQVTIASNGDTTRAYQGDGDAVGNPGGNHVAFFFFDSAAIRSALAGATIDNVYIYLDNVHSYLNSGLMCRIGSHNHDPEPATTGANRMENRWNYSVAKGGDVWTPDLGPTFGQQLRDGTMRGVTVGRGPANDVNYYGYFDRCKIRIKYRK